jgi:hypothetical protein
MSTFSKMKKGEPMMPAAIAARIQELQAEIVSLDNEGYRLAEESFRSPEAAKLYDQNVARAIEVHRTIDRMRAAMVGLELKEKEVAAAGRTADRQERLAEFEQCVHARQKALEEIANGLQIATAGYVKFLASSQLLEQILPAGVSLPMPSATSVELIVDGQLLACDPGPAVSAEAFRIANSVREALPGARAPVLQAVDRPSLIEPLVDAAARHHAAIIADVRAQVERAAAADRQEAA